jgi:hypothetical protein
MFDFLSNLFSGWSMPKLPSFDFGAGLDGWGEWGKATLGQDFGGEIGSMLARDADPYLLQRVREMPSLAGRQGFQDFIAPFEHRAFVRDIAGYDPQQGFASAGFTPAYDIGKTTARLAERAGFGPAMSEFGRFTGGTGAALTSAPSLNNTFQTALGLAEGLPRDPLTAAKFFRPLAFR